MSTRRFWATLPAVMAAGLAFMLYPYHDAYSGISDNASFYPPGGWSNLCSPSSINVTPSENSRTYVAKGSCWINVAKDKTDEKQQSWSQAQVTANGNFSLRDNSFRETLTFAGSSSVTFTGTCSDDPWATKATCTNKNNPWVFLMSNFSWYLSSFPNGPLSASVFSPNLIQSLLSKQESKPPVAPVGLDPVRWPTSGGKAMGMVKWRAGDMSGNKWVLGFDIEYANYADSTFTKAGARVGPGPKQNMSAADANLVYVFSTPFALQTGTDYFFRVCAVNDTGRQCSDPVKAREPTKTELISIAPQHLSGVTLNKQPVSTPTTSPAAPVEKSPTRVFGAALIAKPATGSGGTGGGSSGTGGTGGAAGSGNGGATPGATGTVPNIPDLAVVSNGIQVNDRTMTSNATNRLVMQPDASNTCPVHVSFRYTNLGKKTATNVIAELRDSLQPAQPIATNKDPALAQGQSSTISGVNKVTASTKETKVTYTAVVFEKGKLKDDSNVSNNRGEITLYVLCQASGGGTITAAPVRAPTAVGGMGNKMPTMQK